jgi:hypothetical protein
MICKVCSHEFEMKQCPACKIRRQRLRRNSKRVVPSSRYFAWVKAGEKKLARKMAKEKSAAPD